MSKEFDNRLKEWAVWYDWNAPSVKDPVKAVEFYKKATEGMLELLAMASRDISELEYREKHGLLEAMGIKDVG